jgi:hypothetical protein
MWSVIQHKPLFCWLWDPLLQSPAWIYTTRHNVLWDLCPAYMYKWWGLRTHSQGCIPRGTNFKLRNPFDIKSLFKTILNMHQDGGSVSLQIGLISDYHLPLVVFCTAVVRVYMFKISLNFEPHECWLLVTWKINAKITVSVAIFPEWLQLVLQYYQNNYS